jgi:hypothetical protein
MNALSFQRRVAQAIAAALALVACAPKQPPFQMPKNMEDARGRLLPRIEGRDIGGARDFMREHGFVCDQPVAWERPDGKSPADTAATPGFTHACHAEATAPADAGWRSWTIVLLERKGRVADIQVR